MAGPPEEPRKPSQQAREEDDTRAVPAAPVEVETTDEKTPSNMRAFHKTFERRRRSL